MKSFRGRARRRPAKAVTALLVAAASAILFSAAATPARATSSNVELDRYSIVHGCFALRSQSAGAYVTRSGAGYAATAASAGDASPFRMQATDLGRYLLYDPDRNFLAADGAAVVADSEPSDNSDWTVNESADVFTFANEFVDSDLAVGAGGNLVAVPAGTAGEAGNFTLESADGCPAYPEVDVNATGEPSTGKTGYGEVMGTVEGHMHGMAFEFLGGKAHCGRPWHRFGAPYALVDCEDHEVGNGCAAVLENVLWGNPARCHDPTGWPDFTDWPHHQSLTHEQSYYKWIERAYMGGLRLYVNLMVENKVLCDLYPLKQNSCDEMDSVLLQIERIKQFQDYIDAQSGGPGEGWFRIVTDPFEAREVINDGKLAVVLGMEVSEPFGCSLEAPLYAPPPECTAEAITEWIERLEGLGLRQFEIVNKFDNALTGVAGDGGEIGFVTNGGNWLSTGRFWDLEHCDDENTGNHDHSPTAVEEPHNDDLVIANGLSEYLPPGSAPVYPEGPHCNQQGLSELGEHAIRELMANKMIFDPDHQSLIARNAALDLIESEDYPGIVSSHSWSTPNATPRILGQGGVVMPSAKGSTSFIHKYEHVEAERSGRQYFGLGYGADQNGFASQGAPRGNAEGPLDYPFQSMDPNVTMDRQTSGNRVFDLNTDGVAHYGLYPDWYEDVRIQPGGQAAYDALKRGAESYLQMWERVEGIGEVSCDGWDQLALRKRGLGERVQLGYDPRTTLEQAGQPERRARGWRWCASESGDDAVAATFTRDERVSLILSTVAGHEADGVSPGHAARRLERRAQEVAPGLWVSDEGTDRKFVYTVANGEVSAVGAATAQVASDERLARHVAIAGLD